MISQIRSAPTESTKENPSRTPSLSSKWVVAGSVCHIVIPISRASVIDFECSRFFVGRGLEVSLLPPVDLHVVSSSMDFVFHSCRSRIEGLFVFLVLVVSFLYLKLSLYVVAFLDIHV